MIIYRNNSVDPYFNLASEQYLLDEKNGGIFMLWRNDNAVIIGKNQNAYAEIDLEYVEKNNIKVVRRLTGGGAVFHDIGNINYTFIVPESEKATLDFERFTRPVIKAIEALGVENVCLSGRNDIMIGEQKISGNAQTQYNGKTLHHGTLLYSADLSKLAGALRVDPEKIKSKGIKSVRNRVGNISEYISEKLDTEEFMSYLEGYISKETDSDIIEFSDEDMQKIQQLSDSKYSTWEWNFGKSKEFCTEKKKRYPFGSVAVDLSLENGIIKSVKIFGDFFGLKDVSILEEQLLGLRYEMNEVRNSIDSVILGECICGIDIEQFLELLFS
ncbi:MAG: lipoate--protein ligase [Ruminococcaceae bacterium]|nr:lipoate--protein ligase [Oscillospiraceae bacterium]